MDVISHSLWGATIIRERPQMYWAMFFGALPDFWIVILYLRYVIKNRFRDILSTRYLDNVAPSFYKIYQAVHNFLTGIFFLLLVYFIKPKFWVVVIPYFLHLLLDLFTHRDQWASPMFYPLSKFKFQGINWWQHKWFTRINWLVLILVNLVIWFWK